MTDEQPQSLPVDRQSLLVDMVKCDGHSICAWLFPERVDLDDWGYAWVDPGPIESARDLRSAEAAVSACPRRALNLVPAPRTASGVTR